MAQAQITPYIAQDTVTDFAMRFSSLKYSASLTATTNTTLTIPGTAPRYKAVIKVKNNGVVWVALNKTAETAAGPSFAATDSELISDAKSLCREVKAGDVLNFFSETSATSVSVVLYALNTNN